MDRLFNKFYLIFNSFTISLFSGSNCFVQLFGVNPATCCYDQVFGNLLSGGYPFGGGHFSRSPVPTLSYFDYTDDVVAANIGK